MKLTAERYLMQLEEIEAWIEEEKERLKEIVESATGLGSIDYSVERVQSSSSGDSLASSVIKMIEKKEEVQKNINRFIDIKREIINQIRAIRNTVDDIRMEKILYKKYVQHKSVKQIAYEMGLTSGYISTLHRDALEIFEHSNELKWFEYY